ncbi:MAG TPA: HAMP domain-containing sensor histidine kinase [Solirubrobacterales bacterium]|nr:HAMP domain-containing sensor histidine kinase [Solirubrobacterales bacterium]
MRGRSLSFRLAVASVAAVALAVLLFGIAARIVVTDRLHSSLDESLRRRATDVARLAVSAPALLRAPGALESPISGHQLSVEVLDSEGAIVARSLSLGAKLLPRTTATTTAMQGGTGFADTELDGEAIRVFAAPIAVAGGPASGGVVIVAGGEADIEGTEHRLGLLLVLCGVGAVIVGGALAAFLARYGTGSLRDLSSSAATIARTEDPARRLATPVGPAEVADLATTLNGMLDALAAARERERRFLADASHELRTPLTSLRGNVEYVARHGADPEVIADLESDATRLARLVEDLLALERESAAERPLGPFRLDELVRHAAAGREGVVAEVDGPVTVKGEPDAITRALDNLLENAARHGPAGGEVRIELRRNGAEAEVSVTDAGPGFAPGTEEAAFGRFWRGESADAPGSGLGLAIVRATAERHGGRAWAKGATVTFSLPVLPS